MIELTTSVLMLASAFTPYVSKDLALTDAVAGTTTTATTSSRELSSDHPLSTNTSVEAYVREYYKDVPILAEIARCESTFRQFDSDGNVIIGRVNKGDVGIMQINTYYHGDDAAKLGFDIYTMDGNLAYAKYLYSRYGEDPWSSSSKCWKKYTKIARS